MQKRNSQSEVFNVPWMFILLTKETDSEGGAADTDNKHTLMAAFKAWDRKNMSLQLFLHTAIFKE